MHQESELPDLLQAITQKVVAIIASRKTGDSEWASLFEHWSRILQDMQAFLQLIMQHPSVVTTSIQHYLQEALTLFCQQMQTWQSGELTPLTDKRFGHSAWQQHPGYYWLSQQHLLAEQHVQSTLQRLAIKDQHQLKRATFFAKQFLEALAPNNFLQTNPQLLEETMQQQGKNLLRGLLNFLHDLERDPVRFSISMTDHQAFQIGVNLAITPGTVIYRNELIELIQYTPQTPRVKAIPLLIIPPWINKYYILDLSPENSFIRWLVAAGITVFAISWINPNANYAQKGLDDYLHDGPMAAIHIIQTRLKVAQINTLGFCIGGTLLALLLAYYHAQQKSPIRSATFLATLIDFSDPGDIGIYLDEEQIRRLETKMQQRGYLDGQTMAHAFNSLRASELVWSFFIKNYLQGQKPAAFDILYWNTDSTNMPARMHSEYLRWMYLQNDLVKPNKIIIRHTPLDLSQVKVSTFFVATQKDHIAPWQTVYSGFRLLNGPKQFLLGGSGHIAGIVVPPIGEKYGYYSNSKHPRSAAAWLAGASHQSGSWWPHWGKWLQAKSGAFIKPPDPGVGLQSAPGYYVFQKSALSTPKLPFKESV